MAVFEYKGLDASGKALSGLVDADSPRLARQRLKEDGVYATELVAGKDKPKGNPSITLGGRVRPMDVALLTRQLATLVGAGMPVVECLSALLEQVENQRLKKVLADVREEVKEGTALSDALEALERDKVLAEALGPHIFDNYLRNKREEWHRYISAVHSWEHDRYLRAF